jgi:hypothetical protein
MVTGFLYALSIRNRTSLHTQRTDMADNYLEKKYEDLQARKAKEQRRRQVAWKKRMDAYRKKLAELQKETAPDAERPSPDGGECHP